MRIFAFIIGLLVLSQNSRAEIPFSLDAFHQSQRNDEKILLHFHADWCPTCKAQKKVLFKLEQNGSLKGLTIYSVNFDKEVEFKKEMKVSQQSTFISFYGGVETDRSSGVTSEDGIKTYVDKSLTALMLKEQLRLMKEASAKKIPPEKAKIMEETTEKLRKAQLSEKALKVGDTMPEFSLPDAHGKMVSLKSLVKKGPVIVAFYRGSWCPYCNAQLNSYQQHLPEFQQRHASLVAITPEKPDLTVLTEQKKKLTFSILTDSSNVFAKRLGLVFQVPDELKQIYYQFGIDLAKSQGNEEWKLPVPATYIVSHGAKIVYAFVDVDYTHRADPKDILEALDSINSK